MCTRAFHIRRPVLSVWTVSEPVPRGRRAALMTTRRASTAAGRRCRRCASSPPGDSVLRGVGVPESAGGGGLRADASLFDVSVEVVAADAPFLADLVGLQVATPDPVAYGLLLDLQAAGDLL